MLNLMLLVAAFVLIESSTARAHVKTVVIKGVRKVRR